MTTSSLNRREFISTLGLGGIAITMASNILAEANTVQQPNVVMILVDDLGYGDLSSYGSTDLHTPNIDGIINSGIRFDNFYANCPVCSPTRASLLTGCYPDMVGVPGVIRTHAQNSFGYLAEHAVLLPKVLKEAGYHTAIVGKWHLGLEGANTPNEQGFDHFHGFLGDMMDDYYTHRRHDINYMRLNDEEIDPEGHATDLFSDWAAEYVQSRGASQQPFFLYLAYNAPHTPIQPPDDWLTRVLAREPGIDEKRARLVALIEHMDEGIGRVLNALETSGQQENTLVIFTSDNGGQLNIGASNRELNGGKGQMLEGGIKEPMGASWPGVIQPGTRTEQVGLTMDLFDTICDVAGASCEHETDGISLLPTMLGEEPPEEDRLLFWVRREGGVRYAGQACYAVRQGEWKLLQNHPFEPMRLYNLAQDPGETTPLPESHEMYRKLFGALQHHIIRTGAVPWQKYPVEL